MDKKPILYIIMRNDLLSMNAGKAMAQASHASAQFVKKMSENKSEALEQWLNEGYNFGTTVVLEANKSNLTDFMVNIQDYNYILSVGKIIDTSYPFKGQLELLRLLSPEDYLTYNIQEIDSDIDKYGMKLCTRTEHTCSWTFFYGTDEEHKKFKELCEQFNIHLHR